MRQFLAAMIISVAAPAAAEDWRVLSGAEISDDLDLPRPTVHRLCQMLMDERFLAKTVDGNPEGLSGYRERRQECRHH